jgi:hypothetical protein
VLAHSIEHSSTYSSAFTLKLIRLHEHPYNGTLAKQLVAADLVLSWRK